MFPKASRLGTIFPTAGIGTIYGLLFAGLLLLPFQTHRLNAAVPPAEDTYEAQADPWTITIVKGLIIVGIIAAGKMIGNKMKTPDGTLVAVTVVVDSLNWRDNHLVL